MRPLALLGAEDAAKAPARDLQSDESEGDQVGRAQDHPVVEVAHVETPQESGRLVEGGEPDQGGEHVGVEGEGEEGGGEEKEGQTHQGDEVEVLPTAQVGAGREPEGGEGEAREEGAQYFEESQGTPRVAQQDHAADEAEGVEARARECPERFTERDVADIEGGRQHGVVGVGDLQAKEGVKDRVDDGPVHRGGGEHAGGDEGGVAHRSVGDREGADEVVETDAEGEEVEEGFDETGGEHEPLIPVEEGVALDNVKGAA